MNKKYIEFICLLHGFLIRIKEIHWNTLSNSEHIICDEIQDDFMKFEDDFMECCMGIEGKHFQVGNLRPLLPNSETLFGVLKEFEFDIIVMKKKCDSINESGLSNILDEMMQFINKYKYRVTQK